MRASVHTSLDRLLLGSEPGPRRFFAASGTAAVLLLLTCADVALSQSREVLIGTFGVQREPRTERGRQSEIERLFEDARSDMARGRPLEARRMLEIVIERYPETAGADEARRMLAPIYGAEAEPARPAQRGTDAGPPLPRLTTNSATENEQPLPRAIEAIRTGSAPLTAERHSDAAAGSSGSTEVRRARAFEQDFRSSVGDRVFFGDASVELGSKARTVLAAQAAWLKRYPSVPITIEAHADDHGSRDINANLAARRGEAVRARLIEEGLDPGRIRLLSHGRERPVAPCQDPACAAQNRRVITLIGNAVAGAPLRQGAAVPATTEPRAGLDLRRRN